MRAFITIVFLLVSFVCRAAEDDGATIFRRCEAVANFDVKAASLQAVSDFNYCVGFLRGIVPLLHKIHAYYASAIPSLIDPIKEVQIANTYLSASRYLGQDPCLPEDLTIQSAAVIVTKYGRGHPEFLSKSDSDFVADALISAHPCAKSLQ